MEAFLLGAGGGGGEGDGDDAAHHDHPTFARVFALAGPPGTGKSTTIVEAALRALEDPSARVLLAAPRDFSADVLAAALGAALAARHARAGRPALLRAVDPSRPPAQALTEALPYCTLAAGAGAFEWPAQAAVDAARAVVATCAAAARWLAPSRSADGAPSATTLPLGAPFTHVLIDEAAQAAAPDALAPLVLARGPRGRPARALLVGDPRQLGPSLASPAATAAGLGVSLLERWLARAAVEAERCEGGGLAPASAMLRRTYRAPPSLIALPNRLFYGGALVSAVRDPAALAVPRWAPGAAFGVAVRGGGGGAPSDSSALPPSLRAAAAAASPCVFVGVRGDAVAPGGGAAAHNPLEAATVCQLVRRLVAAVAGDPSEQRAAASSPATGASLPGGWAAAAAAAPPDAPAAAVARRLAVICLTRLQTRTVRSLLRSCGLASVRVGTVADFQGQEADFVLCSTVAAGTRPPPPPPGRRPARRTRLQRRHHAGAAPGRGGGRPGRPVDRRWRWRWRAGGWRAGWWRPRRPSPVVRVPAPRRRSRRLRGRRRRRTRCRRGRRGRRVQRR